jgi:integrase|uniref:AMDV4_10 n=1 Tax=uncultured virus TaxID=340016 RepID=B3GAN1_9VIRU|nr:AMDV4_10 [uncultured virus]
MQFQEALKRYPILDLPSLVSSTFNEKLQNSLDILEKLYLKNKRWIITYSGGKDSTVLVVLGLYMKEIHPDIELSITYSDTMMEIPQMSPVAYGFLSDIEKKYPAYSTMEDNMKRWAIKAEVDTTGLSIKCLRKTYESWLITIYPEKSISILQSVGHTQKVSMEHYANLPFTDRDTLLMKPYVEGWI